VYECILGNHSSCLHHIAAIEGDIEGSSEVTLCTPTAGNEEQDAWTPRDVEHTPSQFISTDIKKQWHSFNANQNHANQNSEIFRISLVLKSLHKTYQKEIFCRVVRSICDSTVAITLTCTKARQKIVRNDATLWRFKNLTNA